MPVETPANARPREDLLSAYYQAGPASQGLIAPLVCPDFGVNRRRGDYGVIPREAFGQRINTKRAPKAKTSESDWTSEGASFSLVEYAHKGHVNEIDVETYDGWFNAEEIQTGRVRDAIDLDFEFDVAEAFFSETTFAENNVNTHAPSLKWDNLASADSIGDVALAMERFLLRYRVMPEVMILPYYLAQKVGQTAQIQNRLTDTYGQVKPGVVPVEKLAAIYNLKQIIVPWGVYNSANPAKDATHNYIWSPTKALLCTISQARDLAFPQIGRRFTLNRQMGVAIDSWDVPDPSGRYVRARAHQSVVMPPDPAGYLLTGLKTP